ncbi:MAG: o-succinylbenzoate synthase [Coleofasciculaceae cyanobacterium]
MKSNQESTPKYQLEFRQYRRKFKQPLITHHGIWDVREGIILRLQDQDGKIGFGEIAPISWFGSETLEQAWDFCQKLPKEITTETIFGIPSILPACQFGFESAWEMGNRKEEKTDFLFPYSHLLPTGASAIDAWQTPWNQGIRTFKWKIGVAHIKEEIKIFNQLIQALPATIQLRLDANGGLSKLQAEQWLEIADYTDNIEFLEQPLPPQQFEAMLEMSRQYSTTIALDESVANLKQLEDCYLRGWRSIFVIKVAIFGSCRGLRQFCQTHEIDTVFSSVFESAIARNAALQLANELACNHRAVGFGVNHWFNEDDTTWLEQLWQY